MAKKTYTLHEALHYIQQRLRAPKDLWNDFAKYKYRSCEGILQAVKPLLEETGMTLTLSDKVEGVCDRVYITAEAKLADNTGNSICVTACAREPFAKKGTDESQITGAASSYARKYALNGLFAIDDNKDADTTNKHASTYEELEGDALAEVAAATTAKQVGEIFRKYQAQDPRFGQKDTRFYKAAIDKATALKNDDPHMRAAAAMATAIK